MAKNKYPVPKSAITERGLKQLIKKGAKGCASISDWAQTNGITPQVVSAFMLKKQGAGIQIPEALGYRPQVVFLPLNEELITHVNPPRKPTKKRKS